MEPTNEIGVETHAISNLFFSTRERLVYSMYDLAKNLSINITEDSNDNSSDRQNRLFCCYSVEEIINGKFICAEKTSFDVDDDECEYDGNSNFAVVYKGFAYTIARVSRLENLSHFPKFKKVDKDFMCKVLHEIFSVTKVFPLLLTISAYGMSDISEISSGVKIGHTAFYAGPSNNLEDFHYSIENGNFIFDSKNHSVISPNTTSFMLWNNIVKWALIHNDEIKSPMLDILMLRYAINMYDGGVIDLSEDEMNEIPKILINSLNSYERKDKVQIVYDLLRKDSEQKEIAFAITKYGSYPHMLMKIAERKIAKELLAKL